MQRSSAGISFTLPLLIQPFYTHPEVHSRLLDANVPQQGSSWQNVPRVSIRDRWGMSTVKGRHWFPDWMCFLFWHRFAHCKCYSDADCSPEFSSSLSSPLSSPMHRVLQEMILVGSHKGMSGTIFIANDECWICIWSGCTGRAGRGYKNAGEYPVHAKVQLHRQAPVFQGAVSHTCNKPQLCSKLMLIWLSGRLVLNVIFSSPSLNSLS